MSILVAVGWVVISAITVLTLAVPFIVLYDGIFGSRRRR